MKAISRLATFFRRLAQINQLPSGDYAYHVTYYQNLESIDDHGLQTGGGQSLGRGGGYQSHSTGSLFLTEESGIPFWYTRMEEWADHRSDNPLEDGLVPVVLRLHWPTDLQWDELGSKDSRSDAFITSSKIDPEMIEFYDGNGWQPISEWQSLDPYVAMEVEEVENPETGEVEELFWFDSSSPLQP